MYEFAFSICDLYIEDITCYEDRVDVLFFFQVRILFAFNGVKIIFLEVIHSKVIA